MCTTHILPNVSWLVTESNQSDGIEARIDESQPRMVAMRSMYGNVLRISQNQDLCTVDNNVAKMLAQLTVRLIEVYTAMRVDIDRKYNCNKNVHIMNGSIKSAFASQGNSDNADNDDESTFTLQTLDEECNRLAEILIGMCLDSRPKVRRAASQAASELRNVTAVRQAAAATVDACASSALEQYSKSKSLKGNSGSKIAETQLAESILVFLHALSALRGFSLLSALSDYAGKLYSLQHPLISQHLTEALLMSLEYDGVDGSNTLALGAEKLDGSMVDAENLSKLIKVAIPDISKLLDKSSSQASAIIDVDTALARLRCTEAAFLRLASLHKAEQARDSMLRLIMSSYVPLIGSKQEALRFGAATTMQRVLGGARLQSISANCMRSLTVSLSSLLSLRYRDGWHLALPVISSLFENCGKSGRGGDEYVSDLILKIEALRADERLKSSVDTSLGIAIRWLGPNFVLKCLPLGLEESIASGTAGRAWLLPLVRSHSKASSIEYWATTLLPLSKRLNQISVESKGVQSKLALAAEVQAWSTLPAFCCWARDTADVFPLIAKDLGLAIAERPELQSIVCSAIVMVLRQNLMVASSSGNGLDYTEDEDEDDDVSELGQADLQNKIDGIHEEETGDVPEFMNQEVATETLECLKGFARNFMPIFFNAVVATQQGQRQNLSRAISMYSKVCDVKLLRGFFRTILKKLINVGKQQDAGDANDDIDVERCTYLDLVNSLLNGLSEEDAIMAYTTARAIVINADASPAALVKRAYRLIVKIIDLQPDVMREKLKDLVEILIATRNSCGTSSRRYRLLLIRRVILIVLKDLNDSKARADGLVPSEVVNAFMGEAVLGVKEHNARARKLAFEHIVILGRAYEAGGHFNEIFNSVLACLAGSTPHMISAAVMALTRLLYEFTDALPSVQELVVAVMQLMRSRAREIIRSVLGFAKVVAVRVPIASVQALLGTIISGLLLWSDDTKNKFKLKVRVILERLVKRCGCETVLEHVPNEHLKLISHIRKMLGRADRKRREGGSTIGDDKDDEGRSLAGKTMSKANTARKSQWRDEDIFSDEDADFKSRVSGRSDGQGTKASTRSRKVGSRLNLPSDRGLSDPIDLLSDSTTKHVLNMQKEKDEMRREAMRTDDDDLFDQDKSGRLVIKKFIKSRKRGREDIGSDKNDDIKSQKSIHSRRSDKKYAGSVAPSKGGLSSKSARTTSSVKKKFVSKVHSGAKYKNKKAGGDHKIAGAPDPYSFWALDRKLLNRRAQKRKGAKEALKGVIKTTTMKGSKSTKQR